MLGILKRTLSCASVICVAAIGTFAQAQSNPVAGNWQCGMSYTEFNRDGSRNSGFTEQFNLYLQPDGNFGLEGMQMGIGGSWQYQGQGTWQYGNTQQGIGVGGKGVRTDPTFGQAPWGFAAYLGPQGQNLYQQHDVPQPNGQGIQARTIIQCQRF